MNRNRFLALVTITLLVAAILRIWQLAAYPPGPHYDEAAELLISRSIAFGGARFFPMVEAYQGREVLFYYLSVPLLAFVQDGMFSLRLLSVYCNLLTIAASVALGRAMFRGRRGLVVGLVVVLLMTLSFPMIWMSRQAFRSSALPLMQALALLFLWRGLRAHRHVSLQLALAGLFAGGAVYTYNSSRLFPFWLLIGGVGLLLFDRAHWRRRLVQGAVFFGTLAVTAAPLALYAVQRPDVFWGRLSEVTETEQAVTLAQSIVLHLKLFFIAGDPYFRYNAPGRPYFTLPEGLLLLLGLALAASRLTRRRIPATERAAYLLALLAPLMVIPSVISVGGLPPSNMRSLGMVPLVFVLVAVGAEWLIRRVAALERSGKALREAFLAVAVCLVTLCVGGILVGAEYFHWASNPALFYEEDADLALAAKWLIEQHVAAGTPVYLAARDKGHPTVMIEPVPPLTWIGTDSLFRPAPGVTGLYIFPRSAPPPADWLAWLAPGAVNDLPPGPDGQPAFQAFRVTGDAPLPVAAPEFSAHNRYLTFAGASAAPIAAGGSGAVSMAWRIDAPPPSADFTPLLLLEDARGSLIFRGDAYMAATDEWRAGETLIQRMRIDVPLGTPPGDYAIKIAWVGRASNTYAPYFNAGGGQGAAWAQIGRLTVTRPATFPDPLALPMDVRRPTEVAPGVTLLGWDAPPPSIRPGETLALTLYWSATEGQRRPFTLRARLGDATLWEGEPTANGYRADQWVNGEVLADRVRWTVPRELPPGGYPLTLDFEAATIALGVVTTVGVARQFEAMPVARVTNVNFADQLLLHGYTLRHDGDKLSLEIVWKALHNTSIDYKIFVHLVDRDGLILAQRDAMPQANTYPTSLWLTDEYVVDSYELPVVNNRYALRVGVYSPENALRLPIVASSEAGSGDYFEIRF